MKYLSIVLLVIACMIGCQIRYSGESMPRISSMSKDEAQIHLARKEAELKVLLEQKKQQEKQYEDAAEANNRFEDNWDHTYSRAVSDARFELRWTMSHISSTEQDIAALKVKIQDIQETNDN